MPSSQSFRSQFEYLGGFRIRLGTFGSRIYTGREISINYIVICTSQFPGIISRIVNRLAPLSGSKCRLNKFNLFFIQLLRSFRDPNNWLQKSLAVVNRRSTGSITVFDIETEMKERFDPPGNWIRGTEMEFDKNWSESRTRIVPVLWTSDLSTCIKIFHRWHTLVSLTSPTLSLFAAHKRGWTSLWRLANPDKASVQLR